MYRNKIIFSITVLLFAAHVLFGQETNEKLKREASRSVIDDALPPPPLPDLKDGCIVRPIQIMPIFKGCKNDSAAYQEQKKCSDEKLVDFMYSRLKWPPDFCGEGTVVVQMVIEKDGSMTNHKIIRDIGGGCGAEALRVIQQMPNWTPATQGGKPVRVQYNLPVKFKIE